MYRGSPLSLGEKVGGEGYTLRQGFEAGMFRQFGQPYCDILLALTGYRGAESREQLHSTTNMKFAVWLAAGRLILGGHGRFIKVSLVV
jgi:hypothetical protein